VVSHVRAHVNAHMGAHGDKDTPKISWPLEGPHSKSCDSQDEIMSICDDIGIIVLYN